MFNNESNKVLTHKGDCELLFYADGDCELLFCTDGEAGIFYPVGTSGEIYTGVYEVTPRTYEQSLDTNNKIMLDDVTVFKIPFSKVSNIYNGYTVNIGG